MNFNFGLGPNIKDEMVRLLKIAKSKISSVFAGMFILDKENQDRPTIHNGEKWQCLAYEEEVKNKEDAFSKNTAFNKDFGKLQDEVARGNHGHKLSDLENDEGFISGIEDIKEIPGRSYKDLQDLPSYQDLNDTALNKKDIASIDGTPIKETVTKLNPASLTGNTLAIKYVNEKGVEQSISIDLSGLNLTDNSIANANYNASTNIITLTEDDGTTHSIDLSEFSIVVNTDANGETTLTQEGVVKATLSRVGQTGQYSHLKGVPTSFPPSSHSHAINEISNLQTELDKKVDFVNSRTGDVVLPILEGTQYIYVQANGTDTQNANELQAAYNTAKTMSPSATKRITIVCAMGNYDFGSSTFVMDTPFIDLVSLDGNRSIIFNANFWVTDRTRGSISITANDVFVKGVDVGDRQFEIGNDLNLLKLENCKGREFSFGRNLVVSGTFINCIGSYDSFGGGGGTASGTFTNCVGGDFSFGAEGIASGVFTNCKGGLYSFGSRLGAIASGTFTDCKGGGASFGYQGTASGTFKNCEAAHKSFGYQGTASGTFKNCVAGIRSFGYNSAVSGTFTNCVGNTGSFGGNTGTLSGKLYYCRLMDGTFLTVSGTGITRLCIDGNNNENNQG